MRALKFSQTLGGTLLLALVGAACQTGPTVSTNVNTTNANSNTTMTNANAAPATTATVIETREPDRYRANVVLTAEATGKQSMSLPTMEVARDGDNRRYTLNLPAPVGQVIFLDRADKRYIVLPSRKQYVELSRETTGFDVRALTPGQMVAQMQRLPGVERVGEEPLMGRTAIKYRYATAAKTSTPAGDVKTENFIYVDKETGLPLRVEGFGQASGNVQGVNSGKFVAEMRDLKTEVNPADFELPAGYAQITQEEIKQQMTFLAGIFQAVMGSMNAMSGANTGGASAPMSSPLSSPMSSPPAATASPAVSPQR